MSNQKSMRTVPVIAVEIRSPCATSFNHPQVCHPVSSSRRNCITDALDCGRVTSPRACSV